MIELSTIDWLNRRQSTDDNHKSIENTPVVLTRLGGIAATAKYRLVARPEAAAVRRGRVDGQEVVRLEALVVCARCRQLEAVLLGAAPPLDEGGTGTSGHVGQGQVRSILAQEVAGPCGLAAKVRLGRMTPPQALRINNALRVNARGACTNERVLTCEWTRVEVVMVEWFRMI